MSRFKTATVVIVALVLSMKIDETEQRPKSHESANRLPDGNDRGHSNPSVSQLIKADEDEHDAGKRGGQKRGWWFSSWFNDESEDEEDAEADRSWNEIPDEEHTGRSFDNLDHSGEDHVIADVEREKVLYSRLWKSTSEQKHRRHKGRRLRYRSVKREDTILNEYPDVIMPGNPDKRITPSIHVVAKGSDRIPVGYDCNGKINGSWEVLTQNGPILYDKRNDLIEIRSAGTYHIYSQIYYHDITTASAMSHCITIGSNQSNQQEVSCALSSSNYARDPENTDYLWENKNTNYVSGTFCLKKGSFIGVTMRNANDQQKHERALIFDRQNCYFGTFKVS